MEDAGSEGAKASATKFAQSASRAVQAKKLRAHDPGKQVDAAPDTSLPPVSGGVAAYMPPQPAAAAASNDVVQPAAPDPASAKLASILKLMTRSKSHPGSSASSLSLLTLPFNEAGSVVMPSAECAVPQSCPLPCRSNTACASL